MAKNTVSAAIEEAVQRGLVGGERDGPLRIHCARVAAKKAVVAGKIALFGSTGKAG